MISEIMQKELKRVLKENFFGQRGIVVWFTGLSGAGKSTLAYELERKLISDGKIVVVLDGDDCRNGINTDLGFSDTDRHENVRRISEVAKILKDNGIIVLVSLITPTNHLRETAQLIIGTDDFKLVFVNTSIEVCEKRDVKGLYAKAKNGEIEQFTGITSVFELPQGSHLNIDTENSTVLDCIKVIVNKLQF